MNITVTDLFDGVTPETSPITIAVVEGASLSGSGLPDGGTADQVLTKIDATDGNAEWRDVAAIITPNAAAVAFTPAGTIAATNTQAAVEEVATDAAAALATHAGAADPHPGYLTPAEGNAAYQPLDGDLTTVAALDSTAAGALVTDGAGWIRKTYAQLKTALALVKADVGLGNVDNTADTAKPVSTAQQTALNLKADLASPALTGNPTAPTPTAGDNDTSIATTAFVTAADGLLVPKSLYDANTILAATTDDTPAALTVAASTFVGRKASGGITAMTVAEAQALLGSGSGPVSIDDLATFNTAHGSTGTDYEMNGHGTTLPSGLTGRNLGTSTTIEDDGALAVNIPSTAGDNVRAVVASLTGTTWQAFLKLGIAPRPGTAVSNYGLVIRDSTSGKLLSFAIAQTDGLALYKWTNETTYSATQTTGSWPGTYICPSYWRIRKNSATSYDFMHSFDGAAWRVQFNYDVSLWLSAPDQVGFYVNYTSAADAIACHWMRFRT